MSLHAENRGAAELAAPADRYDRVLTAVHWLTLLLIAAVYGAVWASHAAGSKEQSALLVQLHRSMGLTILALTLFRLAWRWNARTPPLPAELPFSQKLAARATEYILYVLLLLQPALGLLNTNARARRVDFYFLGELPPVVGPDKALAKQAMAAHELVACLILALVALHAAAALFHHFVRRDNVLNVMLPGRRRCAPRFIGVPPTQSPCTAGSSFLKDRPRCRCAGKNVMRFVAWLGVLLPLAACGSVGAGQSATLILNNPTWDRVNVEAVITTSPNCDNRDAYVSTQQFVMTKNRTQRIEAPKAENICWRHDSNPNNPIAGVWSGWSRATMFPGQTYETEL